MEQAVAAGRESIDVGFLTQALEDRSMGRVEFALEPASTRMLEEFAGVEQALLGIIMAVGRSANSETSIRSLDLGVNLTRTNPEAAHWAKTRSSALIVEISESTRAAIRRIMHLAFIRQIPPRETARLLVDLVGLTEAQAEAVWAFRQELLDSPGRLVRRARTTVRVPARGISAELLAKRVREYSDRLLRHRTLNIARTETIAASNEGQRQVWLQAVENELVSSEVQREWIAAPGERTCPICKALDGQVVGLEERFVLPDGSKVMGPPAHTACRCGQGLTPASLRAASNPCHDPNTGEFCEIGGGKTGGLSSGDHPHASEGRKMVRGWVSDSSSKVAVSLKHGVRDELGAKGTVYDPEKTTSRINEKERVAGRRGARAIYETTQAKMIESGIPEEVVLYRGVTKTRTKRNVIESWTSDPNVAKEFGPTVIKQTFKRTQILAFHGSPIWSRQYQGEQEFVVMPGLS